MAFFILVLLMAPVCVLRSGPILFSLSVPLRLSPKSLAKLDRICRKSTVNSAKTNSEISPCPARNANAEPTNIPEMDKGKVRNLKACNHAFVGLGELFDAMDFYFENEN